MCPSCLEQHQVVGKGRAARVIAKGQGDACLAHLEQQQVTDEIAQHALDLELFVELRVDGPLVHLARGWRGWGGGSREKGGRYPFVHLVGARRGGRDCVGQLWGRGGVATRLFTWREQGGRGGGVDEVALEVGKGKDIGLCS
eukprot:scaffold5532_cov54-Isochrysis_galbana.AAC.2